MIAAWKDRPVPDIVTPPRGPESRRLIEQQSRVFYKGLSSAQDEAPFVMARKAGYGVRIRLMVTVAVLMKSSPEIKLYPELLFLKL